MIGRLGENETPTTSTLTFASGILNKLMKHWETQGVHLWTASYGTIFLRNGVSSYTIGDGTDQAADDVGLVETVLTANASGTSIVVETVDGMTALDNIGILLDTGTRQWTTIVSIVGSTVTLTDALTSAAASGNTVFSYSTDMGRPLKLTDSCLRNDSNADIYMKILGRVEYNRITVKRATGTPYQVYYSPMMGNGRVYVWPVPDNATQRLKVSYLKQIQDLDTGTDNPDLPQEWLYALTYNLARSLATAYGIDLKRKELTDIIDIANQSLMELKAWDSDSGSTFIRPEEYD